MPDPVTDFDDDFNRADGPDLGANYTQTVWLTDADFGISGNACAHDGDQNEFADAYRTDATHGPDFDVFIIVGEFATPTGDDLAIMGRLSTPSATTMDGYLLSIAQGSPDNWNLYSLNNNAFGSPIATSTQAVADGDGIWLNGAGTTIKGYHKSGAGAWTEILSVTDSDHSGAGNVGFYAEQGTGTVTITRFGGGTVVASATAPRTLKMMGIGN